MKNFNFKNLFFKCGKKSAVFFGVTLGCLLVSIVLISFAFQPVLYGMKYKANNANSSDIEYYIFHKNGTFSSLSVAEEDKSKFHYKTEQYSTGIYYAFIEKYSLLEEFESDLDPEYSKFKKGTNCKLYTYTISCSYIVDNHFTIKKNTISSLKNDDTYTAFNWYLLWFFILLGAWATYLIVHLVLNKKILFKKKIKMNY